MSVVSQLVEVEIENTPFKLYQEFFANFTSEHTRKNYRIDILKFFQFLSIHFKDIKNTSRVERSHIIHFRNWLSDVGGRSGNPCAPKTVARKLASLSSYFDFLVEKDECPFNPVTSVKRPRRDVKSPTNALTKEQVRNLFEAAEDNKNSGPLHKALMIMFFTTGMRKSEILKLKYNQIRDINDSKIVEFTGKGGKISQKLLHPVCVEALEEYLTWMKGLNRGHDRDDFLFQPTRNPRDPGNLNKALNPKTINEIIDIYARKVGINFKVTPHSARATFISELLEAGVDIYAVAREVNHSSVTTTQEYDKRLKQIKDSPINKLSY